MCISRRILKERVSSAVFEHRFFDVLSFSVLTVFLFSKKVWKACAWHYLFVSWLLKQEVLNVFFLWAADLSQPLCSGTKTTRDEKRGIDRNQSGMGYERERAVTTGIGWDKQDLNTKQITASRRPATWAYIHMNTHSFTYTYIYSVV